MGAHMGRIRAPTQETHFERAVDRVVAEAGQPAFHGVMWKSDGFRWMGPCWEEGISGLHVSKEEKGRDGVVG